MTALPVALVLAAKDDHMTVGDALAVFGILAGFALVIWALGR